MENISTIVWDWNGTLLDDVDVCIESMNVLLEKRHLPELDKSRYKDVFTFPVIDYYKILGFDFSKEPFDIPAYEFIDAYRKNIYKCTLQEGALKALNYFSIHKIDQFVLSAMEHEELKGSIFHFKIEHYFKEIIGISDHFASGKIVKGKEFIQKWSIVPEKTLLIGDSEHDHEVSSEFGFRCVLIANGHQSDEKLKKTGRLLFQNLNEFIDHFENTKMV